MARQAALLFFAFGILRPLHGQIFTPVFPNLDGSALYQAVVAAYKPVVVLDYANARDTLYAKVLAKDDDSLRCIYSGYTLYLDPTQDPTQYIYFGGSPLGMNTEHAYPQAKGAADGNARSDMHHLFPTRTPVNEARGNLPFAEIPDPLTQQWFYQAQIFISIPTQNIHLYSEGKANAFEPREPVKGDLARAVFYFYTMYTAEAMAADPGFFALQRPTLCQWHDQDRADSAELVKTLRIAPYQENKPNPFVLDCTLARRLYCPELSAQCQTTGIGEPGKTALGLRVLPNPLRDGGQVEMAVPFFGDLKFRLLSLLGQEISVWDASGVGEGQYRFAIQAPRGHAGGLTWLEVSLLHEGRMARQTVPVLLLPE